MNYGYNATCAPPLSGFFGLGAAMTREQRLAAAAARKKTAQQKQAARKATVAAKKAARVAGRTVQTSNPAAAAKIHAAVTAAQAQLKNVTNLAARARQTRQKADVQKALVAATSAGNMINTLIKGGSAPVAAQRLRGMGYMGDLSTCVDDGTGSGGVTDNGDGAGCDQSGGGYTDPTTGMPIASAPVSTGYPITPSYGSAQYGTALNTGLVPGFGAGLPSVFGSGGYMPSGCRAGSNLPRCLIYQMAVSEQQQFQFVFTILQQMYAQLLQIVQQLMAQLQSAQQSPYAYGQNPNPYGANPFDPYGQGQYGQGYGGQYPGPGGYPGAPYYAGGGGDSSVIPAGFDTGGGDMSQGVPGDITQVFPGPGSAGGGGYPIQSYGGPPPGLISSDSLPDGADQTSGDDAGGLIQSSGSGPNLPAGVPAQSNQSTAAPTTAQPQIIVLQQGPGQSAYADAGLPAGDKQNQPQLDPPEHDDWARDN